MSDEGATAGSGLGINAEICINADASTCAKTCINAEACAEAYMDAGADAHIDASSEAGAGGAGSNLQLCSQIREKIESGAYDAAFALLYPQKQPKECRPRYIALIDTFINENGDRPAIVVSAPGRTEVCGNHTDHQHGKVLAAAVDLDIICVASPNDTGVATVRSFGHDPVVVNIDESEPREEEREGSKALVRGIVAWFRERGAKVCGFDACTSSDVLRASGLSSSAAFEVAICNIANTLFGAGMSRQEIAIAGKYAENVYFGKPCGLMDQMASSVGGFVQIDFADPANAAVESVRFDIAAHGLALCVVDTRGDHRDLTGDYAAVPEEMCAVAKHFGKTTLRDVDEREFWKSLPAVRKSAGDRAALRAMHFFFDDALVLDTASALRTGDVQRFLDNTIKSGRSSFCYLQNVYTPSLPGAQGLSIALALSERLLAGKGGAWRVHGGGFAGTIQAFVPFWLLSSYRAAIDAVFGFGACHVLSIRQVGGVVVTPWLANE